MSHLTNLYRETVDELANYGRVESEVEWVGNVKYRCSWEQFAEIAKDTNYNSSWGGTEIATDLKVVGKDFWLERHEYDGSEWWEYKEQPKKPETEFVPHTFISKDGSLTEVIERDGIPKL